jgi:hypothetical protein
VRLDLPGHELPDRLPVQLVVVGVEGALHDDVSFRRCRRAERL